MSSTTMEIDTLYDIVDSMFIDLYIDLIEAHGLER